MKLPRNVSGDELIGRLVRFGYSITRQVGSHVRLTTEQNGQHHLTVPRHSTLRVGTLSGIVNDVADHFGMTRQDVLERLFA